MTKPSTPEAWGIQLSKFWRAAGMGWPVKVDQLALEYTKHLDDPVKKIEGHDVSGVEGVLAKNSGKNCWYILYDKTITSQGRINFTLAHELGHYVLHRSQSDKFECGPPDLLDYESKASKLRENEANRFASYVLMPADDFRSQIEGQKITLDLLGHCADRYGASFTATTLKWLELTGEAAMLVVARDDFICWSYPSKRARELGSYLPPGTEVPHAAINHTLISDASPVRNSSINVPAGVWHKTLEATQTIIQSDKYDLTIILIQFPTSGLIFHEEDDELDSFSPFVDGITKLKF